MMRFLEPFHDLIMTKLMIGDNLLADIQGGNNAGIDTVWYNPDKKPTTAANPTYTVHNYQELLKLLR